jgi:mono/diheme cytochrome c family protein
MNDRKRTLFGVLPLATVMWVAALAFVWGDTQPLNAQPPQAAAAATTASPDSTFLTQYCVGCHNQRAKVAGLALDTLDLSKVGPDAETWEKAIKKIRTGMMPPSGARRPERTALDEFATNLEQRLDKAADPTAALITPALHRLNRTEYANAIRDLLALDVDVNVLLPADGSSQGFDNLAEALADPGLHLSGDEDQPAGGWRQDDGSYADDVLAATGAGAGSPHRGPATRDARRFLDSAHLPARCRV